MAKYYLKAKISVKKIKNSLVSALAAITLVKKRKISLLAKIYTRLRQDKARLSDAKEVKIMANCSACYKKADNAVFSKKNA